MLTRHSIPSQDKDRLVDEVIPKYFVQTKYESFTRQLSGWGE